MSGTVFSDTAATARDVYTTLKSRDADTKFDLKDWLRLGLTSAIVAFAAVDIGIVDQGKAGTNSTDNDKLLLRLNGATQFSYHAHDLNNNGEIHGPFLGKVRLAGNMSVLYSSDFKHSTRQSNCDHAAGIVKATDIDKCKMMRSPDMFFGKVHSSWSVLGAQSLFNLVKHIGFILIAFLVFSWVEDQILTRKESGGNEKFNYFRSHFRLMRSVTVIITIVLFTINIAMDIKDDMHKVDANHENNVAIGSITTGVSFCLVSILIICLSHLDDPYSEGTQQTSTPEKSSVVDQEAVQSTNDETVNYTQPTVVPGYGEMPTEYNFAQQSRQFRGPKHLNFELFGKDVAWSTTPKVIPFASHSTAYLKLQEIHRNIHVSYLMLLLFPLVSILALVRSKNKIVDVHVQLIFFSGIFFAVLDIMQSRVSSVLASFEQENSMSTAIGRVKIFVVLAFNLAKLFVFLPAYQLTVVYYTRTQEIEFGLVLTQLIVFLALSALDLLYIADVLAYFSKLVKMESDAALFVDLRQLVFFLYLFALTWCLYWI